MPLTADDDIRTLLEDARTIALVGASDRPDRPSYRVMKAMQDHGYRVIPVNPMITGEHLHGEFVFRDLAQLGDPIDIVDIFRNSRDAGAAVDEAIAVGAKAVFRPSGSSAARVFRALATHPSPHPDAPKLPPPDIHNKLISATNPPRCSQTLRLPDMPTASRTYRPQVRDAAARDAPSRTRTLLSNIPRAQNTIASAS